MSKVVRKAIFTALGPKPLAPYSQAIQVDNMVYLSGMVGTSDQGSLVEGGVSAEAKQALMHLGNVLQAAGSSFESVVKTTVLLADLNDFGVVNEIYKQYFKEPYPARMAYQVAKLPLGAKIEIDAIAIVGEVEHVKANL
ncbi:2-iminobutanoate/2-iminopropanoate deaminase [Neocloeon triangulifer]|uniref:2-iminobutanoate/2-iminopropanoate deaminase n=1 Tax=Neocloeon triangulifer TaxID=2078957 RepID=UPI00286F852B|nr:2-iminobutanoate/2-iminopropanoate deaminase [Neocloeon triangulifer]